MRSAAPRSRSPRPLALAARLGLLACALGSLALVGCIDHLNNARVRGAEEFECKRAEVQVSEVAEHIFVARGCGQVGAYRCEAGLEGGCKKVQGKAGDKYVAMAPEAEPEEAEKPKKKKKAAEEGDEAEGKTDKKAKDDDGDKPKKSDSSDKPKKEKDEPSSSSKTSKDEDAETEKPKKKKKKKSEDE